MLAHYCGVELGFGGVDPVACGGGAGFVFGVRGDGGRGGVGGEGAGD